MTDSGYPGLQTGVSLSLLYWESFTTKQFTSIKIDIEVGGLATGFEASFLPISFSL